MFLEIFLPPVLGPAICGAYGLFGSVHSGLDADAAFAILTLMFFGFFVGFGLSIPYTLLMEKAFWLGLKPGSLAGGPLSATLGALSGWWLIIGLEYAFGPVAHEVMERFVWLGGFVGAVIGVMCSRMSRAAETKSVAAALDPARLEHRR